MESKNIEMQAIFSELSEKNKDIVILIARSMKVAQEEAIPQEKYSGEESGKNQSKIRLCS